MRRSPEVLLWYRADPDLPRVEEDVLSTERMLDYPDYFTEHFAVVETRKDSEWSVLERDAPNTWRGAWLDKYEAIRGADELEAAYDPLGGGTVSP